MEWSYIDQCWRDPNKKKEAEKLLSDQLHNNNNDPFSRAVTMLEQCLKHSKGKATKTPVAILALLETQVATRDRYLNREVKTAAMNVVLKQRNLALIDKVCDLYKLAEFPMDFLPTARDLVQSAKFNDACLCVSCLKLQKYFAIEDIVIPLYFQDKINLVETYLKDHRDLQIQFLMFLDSLIVDYRKPYNVSSSMNIPDVKPGKLERRAIGKLIARLLKLYEIPPETCPNLCQVRGMGAVKYLVRRRYIEGTVDDENWSDLLLAALGSDKSLHRELVQLLVSYNEAEEALKWAQTLKVERHMWPPALENVLIRHANGPQPVESLSCPSAKNNQDEVWELEDIAYLPLRLDRSDIVVVETLQEFMNCISEVQNYDVVALDGEWKPSFGLQQEKLSLLQLAVWDCIFLLDVLALQIALDASHWEAFVDQVLCNKNIIKLSYGFSSDLVQLIKIAPNCRSKLQKMQNMLDFAVLFPKLQLHCPELLSAASASQERVNPQDSRGLSQLTHTVLGLPLDKSMQFSDWEKRPLRDQQIVYAALDAYCLLQIYEVWHQRASELGQDFVALTKKALAPSSKATQKDKTTKQKPDLPLAHQLVLNSENFDPSRPSMSVSELHLVVDTMLQGLGKHLRLCGVDTHILETEDYHDMAARVAVRENRVILTSGAPYQNLKQHVPVGNCLNIPNGLTAQEQAQIVFRHFNVQLSKDDIFSRCSSCNGDQYVHIPCKDLQQICQNVKNADPFQRNKETVVMYPGGAVDIHLGLVEPKMVRIGLHQLNQTVFDRVKVFYVCARCGKVYWEGSHHVRILKKMSTHMSQKSLPLTTESADSAVNVPLPLAPTACSSSQGSHKSPEPPPTVRTPPNVTSASSSQAERMAAPSPPKSSTNSKTYLPPPPEMLMNSDDEDYDDGYDDFMY